MSIRATNTVRSLTGLTMRQKAVAFVLADHANLKTGLINPSMSTVARESGAANRQHALRIVDELLALGVFARHGASGKPGAGPGRGHTIAYKLNAHPRMHFTQENAHPHMRFPKGKTHTPESENAYPGAQENAYPSVHEGLKTLRVEGVEHFEGGGAGASPAVSSSSEGANPKPDDDRKSDDAPRKFFQPSAQVKTNGNGQVKPKSPVQEKQNHLSRIHSQALAIITKEFPNETAETIMAVLHVVLTRRKSEPATANFLVASFRNEAETCAAQGTRLESYALIARLHRGVEERARSETPTLDYLCPLLPGQRFRKPCRKCGRMHLLERTAEKCNKGHGYTVRRNPKSFEGNQFDPPPRVESHSPQQKFEQRKTMMRLSPKEHWKRGGL